MADGIVVAAPFWDLSVPAVLKVYIENISADGITFGSGPEGLYGLCRGEWMLFLTTRGGIWEGSDMEQGSPYMESLCKFLELTGMPVFRRTESTLWGWIMRKLWQRPWKMWKRPAAN